MNKPIRVAQIMGKLWSGGVEMVVFNYYRAMDKSKIQFDFYYDADSTVIPPQELKDMGARFIKIPPYQNLPLYLKVLEQNFKKNNYKIVHSHINTLSVFPLYMAWKCNIPVRIAHNHSVPGGESLKRIGLKYFLRNFSCLFATDYFACSEKAGRWLFGNKNFDNNKVTVMKNAVNFDRFRPSTDKVGLLKKKLGIEDKFVVGCIGRFTFAKNHQFLIDVFKKLCCLKENAVLVLVGDGELNEQIHTWVFENGLKEKVIFVGQVNDPENYYRLCDVIAVPSVFEGLSLTTIESQIAGVPVVVSKAVPDEAIISNGVIKRQLDIDIWVNSIAEMKIENVSLYSSSEEYNILYAAQILENKYFQIIGERNL